MSISLDVAIAVIARASWEAQRSLTMYVDGHHDEPSWEDLDTSRRCAVIDRVSAMMRGDLARMDESDYILMAGIAAGLEPQLGASPAQPGEKPKPGEQN